MQQRPLQRLMPERQLLAVDDSDAGRAGEGEGEGEGEQDGCSDNDRGATPCHFWAFLGRGALGAAASH